MDPDIAHWTLEFLLRQHLTDNSIDNLLKSLSPFTIANNSLLRFNKTLLLRLIESEVSRNNIRISETLLDFLEAIESIENAEKGKRNRVLDSMKTAYCAVAVDCTVSHLRDRKKYLEAVERIWKGRLRVMEESGKSGLVSEELSVWRERIEAATAGGFGVCGEIMMWDRSEVVRVVKVYLDEAWVMMGPTFLELVWEAIGLEREVGLMSVDKSGGVVFRLAQEDGSEIVDKRGGALVGLGREDGSNTADLRRGVSNGLEREVGSESVDRRGGVSSLARMLCLVRRVRGVGGNLVRRDEGFGENRALGDDAMEKEPDVPNSSRNSIAEVGTSGAGKEVSMHNVVQGSGSSDHFGENRAIGDDAMEKEPNEPNSNRNSIAEVGTSGASREESMHNVVQGLDSSDQPPVNSIAKVGGRVAGREASICKEAQDSGSSGQPPVNSTAEVGSSVAGREASICKVAQGSGSSGQPLVNSTDEVGSSAAGKEVNMRTMVQGSGSSDQPPVRDKRRGTSKANVPLNRKLVASCRGAKRGSKIAEVEEVDTGTLHKEVTKDPLPDALNKANGIVSGLAMKHMNTECEMQNQSGRDEDVPNSAAHGSGEFLATKRINTECEVQSQSGRGADVPNLAAHGNAEPAHTSKSNTETQTKDGQDVAPNPSGNEGVDPALTSKDTGGGHSDSYPNNVPRCSLMKRNSTVRVSEQDDSIDNKLERTQKRMKLRPPKRPVVSPLKENESPTISRRRQMKKWTNLEEDTLRRGVQRFGKGNWKLILNAYRDILKERTEVDLKDKWRNMSRY